MDALKALFRDKTGDTKAQIAGALKALGQEPDDAKVNAINGYWMSEVPQPLAEKIAVEVEPAAPGFSGVYRSATSPDKLLSTPEECGAKEYLHGCRNVGTCWVAAARNFKDDPLLFVPKPSAEGFEYTTRTYGEVFADTVAFGKGLKALGGDGLAAHNFIGVHLKTSAEWTIIQLGSAIAGLVPTTMYDSLGVEGMRHILNTSETSVLITSTAKLAQLSEDILPHTSSVKLVVVVGEKDEVAKAATAVPANITVVTFDDVLSAGRADGADYDAAMAEAKGVDPSALYLLCFTSGTTGVPKGVPVRHSAMVASFMGGLSTIFTAVSPDAPVRHLAFLPMAHVMEQWVQIALILYGARIGFMKGPLLGLADEIKAFGPSLFVTAPRVLNKFYAKITAGVDALRTTEPAKAAVFDMALQTKKEVLEKDNLYRSPWDLTVFANVRAAFGGNIKAIITGSAPIAQEVQNFFRWTLGVPVFEGYGMTEILVTTANPPGAWHTMPGSIGTMFPVVEFKTRDLPEMRYTATSEGGPAGELLVRGPTVMEGYFKAPELTAEVLKDGWMATGDVVRIGKAGELRIVDRAKALFKLSQGEYVAPEKVESVVQRVPGLAAAFVHGESKLDFPVAVVVIDPTIPADARPSVEELEERLEAFCRKEKLAGYEIPKAIVVSPKMFEELGLMTPSMKIVRFSMKEYFLQDMTAAYERVAAKLAAARS